MGGFSKKGTSGDVDRLISKGGRVEGWIFKKGPKWRCRWSILDVLTHLCIVKKLYYISYRIDFILIGSRATKYKRD